MNEGRGITKEGLAQRSGIDDAVVQISVDQAIKI